MMAKTGILITTHPGKFSKVIPRLTCEIKSTLYVHYHPLKDSPLYNKISLPSSFSSSVISLYKSSLDICQIDVRVLLSSFRNPGLKPINTKKPIEVVYYDDYLNREEMKGLMSSCIINKTEDCHAVPLGDLGDSLEHINGDDPEQYNYVVLGGTFDRLHVGHKILLSEAILRCNKKLTVGVTDLNMLKSKKLWELIEPCKSRISKVRDFLEDIEPNLEYDIVPINDVFGPTKDDPSFEFIIVSAETVGGGKKINEVRLQNGLKALKVHSVELISDKKQDEEEEDKVSSSNDRLRMLGTLISPLKLKPYVPSLPYLIGLTGGIASGKSSLSLRLQRLGAAIIDCDKVAHSLYNKGTPLNSKILEIFGKDLESEAGEINRRKLGDIVFNNKEKLEILNKLLWPCILDKSKEMAQDFYTAGHKVVVLEAALLIQAGWDAHVHEVWASIIPPDEAVRRLKNRNKLSEEDAASRISSQPTNTEIVQKANVVFCTLWREEYSQKQIERAWKGLLSRLPS